MKDAAQVEQRGRAAFLPLAGRLSGRLPASTACVTQSRSFDRVGAAAVRAPYAPEEAGSGYQDPGDVIVLAFVTAGSVASVAGRDTHIRSRGEMALSQLSRIDKVGMTLDYRSVSLRFADGLIQVAPREVDWLMRHRFAQSEPLPRLLGMICRELLTAGPKLGRGSSTAMTQSAVNLCAGLFDDALGRNSPPERKSRNLVAQALHYIDVNASCPGIDPQRVADALKVSIRTLHKAFEGEPASVAQAILASRLATAERLLRSGGSRIDEVAAQSGFSSPSSFSRAFRRVHDLTPRDWRRRYAERT